MLGFRPIVDARGPLRIWYPPSPGIEYVIGADVAEGVEGGDYSCAWVIEGHSKRHVATWHGAMDPWDFTDQLVTLARYYNSAILAPESNNHGHTVIDRLVHEIDYPNLYSPTRRHDRKGKVKASKDAAAGWRTTEGSKRRIMDVLRTVVHLCLPIHDDRFYFEGLTWTKNKRGMGEASEGAFDDTMMAAGIAYCVASEMFSPIRMERVAIKEGDDERGKRRKVENWRKIHRATQDSMSTLGQGAASAPPPELG